MREYDLKRFIENTEARDEKIKELQKSKLLKIQKVDSKEIQGHIAKAEHNLEFVLSIQKKDFPDWAITGCYYACYHAALALIQTKGYTSKNHLATLLILIKEFYKEMTPDDIELLSRFLEYEDLLFYVQSKHKRENASYSTIRVFDTKEIEKLRIQAVLFVNKVKEIITK